MRPRVLSISPYAAADVDLVVTSEQPSSLVPLTLTTDPFVFDVPRTLLLTFADGPVDAAIAEDDAVFTDQTTEANEGTADDMDLLPAVPVLIEDKYYFGAQNPFGRLDLDVSTVGTGTYTLTWEYFNGSTWVALSGVTDGTTDFKTSGLESVTFTIPSDWAATTVNSQGPFFFIRAEMQAGTVTQVPLGEQAFIGGTAATNRFLIKGKDSKGNTIVESVVGAAAAATVESSRVFAQIDSITPEFSGDGLMQAGTLSRVPTPWLPLDYIISNFKVSLSLIFGGALTPDFDVEVTLSNLLARRGNDPQPTVGSHVGSEFGLVMPVINVQAHDTLVAVVADATGNLAFPVRAIRLVSTQVFTVEQVQMEVIQSGHTGR